MRGERIQALSPVAPEQATSWQDKLNIAFQRGVNKVEMGAFSCGRPGVAPS